MVNEIWTSIESFENHYEVSNYGRVRSYKNNKNGLTPNFKILKNKIDSNGYHYITLCKNKKKKNFSIHRLVVFNFKKDLVIYNKNFCVDHIDNNKNNNYIDNLQVISNRLNSTKDRKRTCKYPGITKRKDKYLASCYVKKQKIHIGSYLTQEDAYLAYQNYINKVDDLNIQIH